MFRNTTPRKFNLSFLSSKLSEYSCLLILFIAFSLSACNDSSNPVAPEPEQPLGWTEDASYFRDSKILLNAEVSDDSSSFIVAGLSDLVLYRTNDADSVRRVFPRNDDLLNSKPAISDKYVAYTGTGSTQFIINSPLYAIGSVSNASFPFYSNFELNNFSGYSAKAKIPDLFGQKPMGAFNSRDQFFTVISDTADASDINITVSLVDINPTTQSGVSSYSLLEINPEVTRIQYPTETSTYTSYIYSHNDNFYASIDGNLMRVTPDGNARRADGINSRIQNMFAQGDSLFAYSRSRNTIYRSLDDGLRWSPHIEQFPIDQPHFFFMDDTLSFYVYSQLAWVDLDQGRIIELDNRGMEGDEITSVNKFNGRVWVTTLSGMYYKPADKFFTKKEESQSSKAKLRQQFKIVQ